jgi:DNA gyrase subunit A
MDTVKEHLLRSILHKVGGGGVITSKVTEKTGLVATARVIAEKDNDLMIISAGGVVIRTDVSTIHVAGRATQGVRLMNLGEGDSVVAVATTNGKTMDEQNGIEDDVEESEEQETEAQENNESETSSLSPPTNH